MPLYEYQCDACGHRIEVLQRRRADLPPACCTACGNEALTRVPAAPAIQFKGSGWYVTDYARKEEAKSS